MSMWLHDYMVTWLYGYVTKCLPAHILLGYKGRRLQATWQHGYMGT